MSAQLVGRLQPLVQEIRGNPRLMAGSALIGLLVLGWVFLVLGDWRTQKLAELDESRQRLARVQQLAEQQAWPERAAEAMQLADALEAEIPAAGSAGLAQADFQAWLREIVDGQAEALRLEVQPPVMLERPADVVRVAGTISGSLPPSRVVQLANRIESRASLATIPAITVRSDGLNRTFSLTVHGFYRMSAPEPQP